MRVLERGLLDDLDLMGIPLFTLRPGRGIDGKYVAPKEWQLFTSDGNEERLAKATEGCAYAMVGGHGIDVIDIDPRNKGTEYARNLFTRGMLQAPLWVVRTKRGGWHLYVASFGSGKHQSIVPGVDLQGEKSFAFIPPTEGYELVRP